MNAPAPEAPRLAGALVAVNRGDADAAERLAEAADSDEEVLVPLSDDRETPMAMGDDADPRFLVAFTSLDRVRHAMPDAPPVGVVGVRQVLGWAVRFATPVRLDATSPAEVRISPDAAAALAEGRPAPDGAALARGARYDPPRGEVAVPDLPPQREDPPAHRAPAYGTSWQPGTTDLDGALDPADAQRRHDAGEPYVALIPRDDRAPVIVEVTPERVTSRFLDAAGRDDLVLNFVRCEGILFQDELAMKTFDGGTPANAPSSVQIFRFEPDGTQRIWLSDLSGEGQTIDQYDVDVSGHWERFPAFGRYDGVLNLDR
ncbi:MAG: hypothetical protein ACRDTX_22755 [Pseudonocardiaceae bacterium]